MQGGRIEEGKDGSQEMMDDMLLCSFGHLANPICWLAGISARR